MSKSRYTSHNTPKRKSNDKPDGPTAIVSQKASEDSGQGVEVVEHRPSYNLVDYSLPSVSKLTERVICLIVIISEAYA